MRVKSLKVFIGVLMFGLLLGVSSTARADAISVTSFSFTNLQFTPSAGTAQFTVTGVTARADASNLPLTQTSTSNSFPIAQASAAVDGVTAAATANAATHSLSADTTVGIGGCSCAAGSFGQAILMGTLVLSGATGNVDVNISALQSFLWLVQNDQFGQYAESGLNFDFFVNGAPVFSLQVDALHPVFQNGFGTVQGAGEISRTITVQGGSTNTILARLSTTSLGINEVPEPASVLLLVSGLGFMTGVLKKRRNR
jgi:hypothetical protein